MIEISNYNFSIIKKSSDNFVIVNNTLDTHAHLGSYKGRKILLGLIKRNEDIKNPYLRVAKERLIPKKNKRKNNGIITEAESRERQWEIKEHKEDAKKWIKKQ